MVDDQANVIKGVKTIFDYCKKDDFTPCVVEFSNGNYLDYRALFGFSTSHKDDLLKNYYNMNEADFENNFYNIYFDVRYFHTLHKPRRFKATRKNNGSNTHRLICRLSSETNESKPQKQIADESKMQEQINDYVNKEKQEVGAIKVMQWNQKFLRDQEGDNDIRKEVKEKIHNKRIYNIANTILSSNCDVIVMQEIMDKEIIKSIVEELNGSIRNKEGEYTCEVTKDSVASSPTNKERFACIYRKAVVGEASHQVLFEHGFQPTEEGYIRRIKNREPESDQRSGMQTRSNDPKALAALNEDDKKKIENIVVVDERLKIDMATMDDLYKNNDSYKDLDSSEKPFLYKQVEKACDWFRPSHRELQHNGEDMNFDYHPVLFKFTGTANGVPPFHVVAVHGSTGSKKWKETGKTKMVFEQNMLEMMYIQYFCSELVKKGQMVILLGDFNTQERANRLDCLWDMKINWDNSYPILYKTKSKAFEKKYKHNIEMLVKPIITQFLKDFERALSLYLPTNVYPFLASTTGIPKHNDDIWIAKTRGWQLAGAECSKIPDDVLCDWHKASQGFYLSLAETETLAPTPALAPASTETSRMGNTGSDSSVQSNAETNFVSNNPNRNLNLDNPNSDLNESKIKISKLQEEIEKLHEEIKKWEDKYEQEINREKNIRRAPKINSLLSMMWSDHRPLIATIKYPTSHSNSNDGSSSGGNSGGSTGVSSNSNSNDGSSGGGNSGGSTGVSTNSGSNSVSGNSNSNSNDGSSSIGDSSSVIQLNEQQLREQQLNEQWNASISPITPMKTVNQRPLN